MRPAFRPEQRAGALDQLKVEAKALSYEGVFGVGYGVCGSDAGRNFGEQFVQKEKAELARQSGQEDIYVQLARQTIERYVRTGEKLAVPEGLPRELYDQKAGAFVSIKENGNLRGCIGTIQAARASVAEEIIENAVSALAGREIPLHVTRFFPRYHMTDRDATDVETVYSLAETARKHLKYVYTGNC